MRATFSGLLPNGSRPSSSRSPTDRATTGGNASDIEPYLDGYEKHTFERYGWSSEFVVFVREDWRQYASVESRVFDALDPDGGNQSVAPARVGR
ncbi:hypothetical protein GQS65_07225 [Halomarina oriensis]|uniref:Uncharacterized protein n=1 Tax=Halomarina oriensis TaxID=671145 RepID=A0A6B0GHD6_9EURY|nr:hypothetical protein [Halomarina oriensis]